MTNLTASIESIPSFCLILVGISALVVSISRFFLIQKTSVWENIGILSGALILIFIAYSPVFYNSHLFWDDYQMMVLEKWHVQMHPQYYFIYGIGRPIANFFLLPVFASIIEFNTLYGARLMSLSVTLAVFFVTYKGLLVLEIKRSHAFMLGIALVTNITFHIYNYYIMSSYIPVGIIFSVVSFLFAAQVIQVSSLESQTKSPTLITCLKSVIHCRRNVVMLTLSTLLLILSLSTYQTMAGFFTALSIGHLLVFTKNNIFKLKNSLLVFGTVFASSHIIYFVTFKLGLRFFSYNETSASYDTNALTYLFDPVFLWHKLAWFFQGPLKFAANPFNSWSLTLSLLVLAFFVLTFVIFFIRELIQQKSDKDAMLWIILKFSFICAFIPLTHIAVIISDNAQINYRSIAALCFLVMLVNYLGVKEMGGMVRINTPWKRWNIVSVLSLVLMIICAYNLVNTHSSLRDIKNKHAKEVDTIAAKIVSLPLDQLKAIKISTYTSSPVPSNPYHDLNAYSVTPDYVQLMLKYIFLKNNLDLHHLPSIDIDIRYKGRDISVQKNGRFSQITLIKEGYHNFNIIQMEKMYFAIPQGEGSFEISRIKNSDYSILFSAETERNLIGQIDAYIQLNQIDTIHTSLTKKQDLTDTNEAAFQPILIKEGHHHFNIIKMAELYFAIPQGEGEFAFSHISRRAYSALFIAENTKTIMSQIDSFLEFDEKGKEKIVRQHYHFFDNNKRLTDILYGSTHNDNHKTITQETSNEASLKENRQLFDSNKELIKEELRNWRTHTLTIDLEPAL